MIAEFWGKARPDDQGNAQTHPLPAHSLDVAALAILLSGRRNPGIDPRMLAGHLPSAGPAAPGGEMRLCCLCGGDRLLLAPGSPCGHGGLALLLTHRAAEALDKSAAYRDGGGVLAELMLVRIAVCKTRKTPCGVSLPLHREDEGQLVHGAGEARVSERPRQLECPECCSAARLELIVEDHEGRQRVQRNELS
jgi:hypothetical protein